MSRGAYKVPPPQVGGFRLIKTGTNLAFYEDDDKTVVLAIAGTRSAHEAITEWWRVPFNLIDSGARYKEVESALLAARREFPDATGWFGVGHSLAGSIIDTLIDKGLLDGGHTFNPAIQSKHLLKPTKNTRIFKEGDLLGTLAKPFRADAQYRKKGMWATRIARAFSPISTPFVYGYEALSRHNLKNFGDEDDTTPSGADGGDGGDFGAPAAAGGIRPMLCRVGSKARFAKLLDFIAPPHTVYVEPFAGSAAFYWHKEPVAKEVLNDLDKDVAQTLRLIKKAPVEPSKYPKITSQAAAKRFFLDKPRGVANELVWQLISHCGGWMGQPVNKNTGTIQRVNIGDAIANKIKHIEEYKQRMKHTTVTSQDYATVLRKYGNSKESFIFMDPPYEESDNLGYAEELGFDFDRFAKEVHKLKSNWLITINDSPRIRSLFKNDYIQSLSIKGHKTGFKNTRTSAIHNTIGSKDRKELLISNFPLPSGWREHKGSRVA
jgi:DNA adenine methylase